MFQAYSRLLETRPILTKALTGGLLFSLGDACTQKLIQKKAQFDFQRNFQLFVMGSCYIAPVLHLWYCKTLPMIRAKLYPGVSKGTNVLISMLFDQLAFAPIMLTGFLTTVTMLNDPSVEGFKKGLETARTKMKDVLLANWKIWPVATLINFAFVPMKYQVLFANFVGFFWNMILSYMTFQK